MRKAVPVLLVCVVAGCTSLGDSPDDRPATNVTAPSPRPAADVGDSLAVYLQTLRSLIEGDPVVQADVFRNVAAQADAAPTTTNRLMLALALATPTHPSSDAAAAQRLLSDLLARGDALLPEEQVLALIHLKDVEQRLILDAEAERLQRAAAAATAQRNDRSAQQLQAALEENRQLKAALDEARAKLDAITNIERSIRERENAPDSQ
ncbi:MAG TPA: hypothetical protein VM692_15675 [Gammaproteobacteria bacterium]|nr:hypothetical protein [Gammaproteobacteria bacterium]